VIQVFKCPSCGASLSYEGGSAPTTTCQFCGATVEVPEELRTKSKPTPLAPSAPGLDLGGMLPGLPLDKLAELKQLARSGQKIEAIKLYRELFPQAGLAEAKEAVEKLEAGQPLVFTSMTVESSGAADANQSARLAEVLELARAGQKIEAIKLFRGITGIGLKESKDAVEAMEAGQSVDVSQFPVQSPRASTDRATRLMDVMELAHAGRKIEAIKLYREIYGVGLKEAKDAVEAMGTGAGKPVTAELARRAVRTVGCATTALILLCGVGIAAFVLAMVFGVTFRMSGSYRQALAAAQSDPAVVEALGAPVAARWGVISGSLSCSGSACHADYTIPIHGSKKSGRLRVTSYSEGVTFGNDGTWTLSAWVVVDEGATLTLTTPPTPAPTLSAAQIDATAGAVARATRQAQDTADARAAATAQAIRVSTATAGAETTAQARLDATATAQAQAIADAMIARQASWPAVITETFNDNHLGWPVGLSEDEFIAVDTAITDGKYAWTVNPKKGGSYENLIPEAGGEFTDFYATVDIQFVRGNDDDGYAYGLVFRRVEDDYGFFGVERDGRFRVMVVHDSGIYTLIDYDAPAVLPGQPNRLTVRAIGSDLVFQINDQVVWYLSDDSLDPGEIGLGVDALSNGGEAQVEFANFEVHAPK